jgi:hypothetical protein
MMPKMNFLVLEGRLHRVLKDLFKASCCLRSERITILVGSEIVSRVTLFCQLELSSFCVDLLAVCWKQVL